MLIKILDMDTRKGLFLVGAVNTGETIKVTGYQLVHSLTCSNECVNAELHNAGIFIKMENGEVVKYNVKPIDAKLKSAIRKSLASKAPIVEPKPVQKPIEQRAVQSETKEAVKQVQPKPTVKVKAECKPANTNGVIRRQISDEPPGTREEKLRIYYMGTIYNSPKEICKKFGCTDIEKFIKLYKLGYPMLMCLGKEPFNPNLKVVPREKQHESYLRSIGQQ